MWAPRRLAREVKPREIHHQKGSPQTEATAITEAVLLRERDHPAWPCSVPWQSGPSLVLAVFPRIMEQLAALDYRE
jgi:hypothetical protein